jgi:tRNA threonylcarbamoyladenosine biosynthesis protein TsaB
VAQRVNILAIDTATEYLSLALSVEDKISSVFKKVDNKHSNNIIPYIQQILKEQNLSIADLSLIAYNQGPGSFTGLRIGLSVALGIAYGLDIKLVPIPAFMLHAAKFNTDGLDLQQIIVGLDARLGQMYYAGVSLPDFSYFIQPTLINPQDICMSDSVTLCGNGFMIYKDQLTTEIKEQINVQQSCNSYGGVNLSANEKDKIENRSSLCNGINDNYPGAGYMIGLVNSGKFKAIDPIHADLLYLRNKVALNLEEQKLARANKL